MVQAIWKARPLGKLNDSLLLSLARLGQALAATVPGHESEWAEAVGDALARVQQGLRDHLLSTPDGRLAETDPTRLAQQTDDVCRDERDLLEQVVALRKDVQRVAKAFASSIGGLAQARGVPEQSGLVAPAAFGALRRELEQFVARLQQNKEAEKSVNTDNAAVAQFEGEGGAVNVP